MAWLFFNTPGQRAPDFDAPTDSDHDNSYFVSTRAFDGSDPLQDPQYITVNVTDSPTAPPEITSNGGGGRAEITVAENTTAVTTVTTTDLDGPTTAYAIVGGQDATAFNIHSTTGVLEFITPPDVDAPSDSDHDNFYFVVVRASDGTAHDEQLLSVRVTDDVPPVITSNGGGDSATIAVAENTTAVTTVTTIDPDGPSDRMWYFIDGGADAAAFTIDSLTGVLSFVAAPDFEAPTDSNHDNSYEVVVRAEDSILFDEQTITVNVTDVPPGQPVITSNGGGDTATVTLNENTIAVTTVVATPPESLAYAIVGGADAARFAIDPASGVLSFIIPPDVEAPSDVGGDNSYEVTVRASTGVLFDEQAITVEVTGVPDGRSIIPAHLGDVLWQHDDRTLATFAANIGALAAGASVSGIGDFDRDGDSDILVRNADMTAEIWELDGSNHVATHDLPVVSDWWSIPGVGDFDRDGDSDILLRHREGLVVVWEIEDSAYVVNHNQPHVSDSWRWVAGDFPGDGDTDMPWQWNWWRVVGTGDFDRDGDDDILWRHSDDGPTVMWEMEDGAYVVNHNLERLTDAWQVAGTGDFDGDGDDDVVWRGDGDQVAAWDIGNWAATSHDLPDVPAVWQIEGTRDFDGDGDSDILWRHQQGAVATWDMQAGALAGTDDFGVVATEWQIRGTGEFDLA
jgi:hypothetical protein